MREEKKKIKVLVVDDSALMRRMISDILNSNPYTEVIGTARNGQEALEKVNNLNPDVITLDIRMPDMSGLDVLYEVMRKNPTPVIVISAYTKIGNHDSVKAFEYGAVDVIQKPSGPISLDLNSIKDEIIRLVRTAAVAEIKNLILKKSKKITKELPESEKILVIGASTGGPPAIRTVLSAFPKDFPTPILVIQHMHEGFTKTFAERLNQICRIEVKEAEDGDVLKDGFAYVAPGGYHLEIKRLGNKIIIKLTKKPPVHALRPCMDVTLESVANIYRENTIAVILTGMGKDGTEGMKLVKQKGGKTIAQDEKTSVIFGMPRSAIESGCVDYVLPIEKISEGILKVL